MNFFFILLTATLIVGCSPKHHVEYVYNDELTIKLEQALSNLNDDTLGLNASDNDEDVFALVDFYEGKTIIVFGFTENMSQSIINLIKKSNRMLRIGKNKIPVIFYFDDDYSIIREGKRQIGSFRGYLIEFDTFGEVLLSGPVY